MVMEVEECPHGPSGVPNCHFARFVRIPAVDRVQHLPEVFVGLNQSASGGFSELRSGRMSRLPNESPQETRRIIQRSHRTPPAERIVHVGPGGRDLGRCLPWGVLQDRDEYAVPHEVMDGGAFATNDNEDIDVGMRAFLAASDRAIHPDRHDVLPLAVPEVPRERRRELKAARRGHVWHIQGRGHEPFRRSAAFMDRQRIPVAMMRLTTIALVVSDAKKSAKWYTEKLDFEIRDHQGHWITVAPKKENIAFHLCEGYYPLEPGNSGISFVSKNVKKEEESLRKLGVQFTTPTTKEDWGTYAMFKDPDGNEFWLIEE